MAAEVVTITCPQSGSRARILVSQGFNCFEYRALVGETEIDVLWSLPNFESGQQRASSSGIPLLFPFPGRIRGTSFSWSGKSYSLEPGDKFGNAIHGFCHTRAWRVIEHDASFITGEFDSRSDPTLKDRWPSDFRITATYAFRMGALTGQYTFENVGSQPLPCGFGIHPYFRVPLGSGAADDCIVRLPISREWELGDMLPTGMERDVSGAKEYQSGVRFADLTLDNVFAGLTFDGDRSSAQLIDAANSHQLTISWDRTFRELVVYTPPHREAICIEPYTCVPGAMELAARGMDAGLTILQPGERKSTNVTIQVI